MSRGRAIRLETIFAIRDAEGLTAAEKVFLFVVESRGQMFASAKNAAADMGLSRAMYYKVRNRLIAKGLLAARTRAQRTTLYEVDRDAVAALARIAQGVHTEDAIVHTMDGYLPTASSGVHRGELGIHGVDRGVCQEALEEDPEVVPEGDQKTTRQVRPEMVPGNPMVESPLRNPADVATRLSNYVRPELGDARIRWEEDHWLVGTAQIYGIFTSVNGLHSLQIEDLGVSYELQGTTDDWADLVNSSSEFRVSLSAAVSDAKNAARSGSTPRTAMHSPEAG